MPRKSYQESLEALRRGVVEMGELVVSRLETALESMETGDRAQAETVIDGDDELNERYLALEERCVELFALQQPVAGDLRLITASFKILTDLERIGDLAVNLAEYSLAGEDDLAPEISIQRIGEDVVDLFERSLAAYETDDVEACWTIAAEDDEIDALCQRASETVARELIEREADSDGPWSVEQLLDEVSRVLLTVRDLERIADHGVNIAARTLYMVENDPALIY